MNTNLDVSPGGTRNVAEWHSAEAEMVALSSDPTRGVRPWLLEAPLPLTVQAPRRECPKSSVRLHANELTEPWPEEVLAAVCGAISNESFNRYPHADLSLRKIIGSGYDVAADSVVLGAGSLEIICLLIRCLAATGDLQRSCVLAPDPTFTGYRDLAWAHGLRVLSVPLREDFDLDMPALEKALADGVGVCFLARPNNPTGTLWPTQVLCSLITSYPSTIFAIDEAYLAYADVPSLWSSSTPPNLVCISSFSKIGLAGARLGYAIAHADVAARLRAYQLPFTVSGLSLAIGELLLTRFRVTHMNLVSRVRTNRERLGEILRRIPQSVVFPSAANHVLAKLATDNVASAFAKYLEHRGVLVHNFTPENRLSNYVRVTVGTTSELDVLEILVNSFLLEEDASVVCP